MSFATAFLNQRDTDYSDNQIAETVASILESISPEYDVPIALPNVRASNLCYGAPMQWAIGDGVNSNRTRSLLRERLTTFEPRLKTLSEIDIVEDEDQNAVIFLIVGTTQLGSQTEIVEIEKRLSRIDQHTDREG